MLKRFNITITNNKPTCAELAGYELPELESDPIGQPLTDYVNQRHNQDECSGFIDGYAKARERYEFTKQDLIDLVQSLKDYTYESGGVLGYDEREASEFVDIFLNGRNRTPIAIEVEMEPMCADDAFGKTYQIGWQPILNPDGTVKGTYIFNE